MLLPAIVAAQTHLASVRGTVYDPNRAAIPNAKISVKSFATNTVRTASSDDNGEYAISSLPAGRYELKIEVQLFQTHTQIIELKVNQ